MNYQEALSAIESAGLDNAADILKAIKDDKFNVIGEKMRATTRAKELEGLLDTITKAVGVEGDDLDSKVKAMSGKVQELTGQVTTLTQKLTETETAKTQAEQAKAELENQTKTFQRDSLLRDAATKAGAEFSVLKRLAGDLPVVVDGEVVKIGEGEAAKPLAEFAEASEDWKPFLPALFPSNSPDPKPAPKTPTGGPNPGNTQSDPAANYLSRTYTVPVVKK